MTDVVVLVTLDTSIPVRKSFLPLIVSNEGPMDYKVYSDLPSVKADYAETTGAYKAARDTWKQKNPLGVVDKLAIMGLDSAATPTEIVDALDELRKTQDDFFFVLPTSTEEAIITALADWAAATVLTEQEIMAGEVDSEKILFAQMSAKPTGTINMAQTVLCFNEDADNTNMAAAWVGRVAPNFPTSVTYKFKTLEGIPLCTLKGDALKEILDANMNTYVRRNDRDYMVNGVCADGEFIDAVIGKWQLKQALQRGITNVLVDNEVVPYDDEGFLKIGAQAIVALEEGVTNGIIRRNNSDEGIYTISIPTYEDATPEQDKDRIMPPIDWEAELRGAVHGVKIRGRLVVDLSAVAG